MVRRRVARSVLSGLFPAWLLLAALCGATPSVLLGQEARQESPATAPSAPTAEADVFRKAAPEDLADLEALERQVQAVVETITAATVGVQVGRAQGSGVIVSRDGYVLTAAHVTGGPGKTVTLILPGGKRVKAKSLGVNRGVDAGLMKISDEGEWPCVEMGNMKDVSVGDWCIATGHPGGYRSDRTPVVRLGRVILARSSVIQTDCTLVGGDSGGPLFDIQGRVIGINSRIGQSTSWNFHVPISAYTEGWERLAAGDSWGAVPESGGAVLGVSGEDHAQGCRVTAVSPDLPAGKAGVQVGDVIVKFDGQNFVGFEGLATLVGRKKPGDKVTIVLLRGDEQQEMTVELARRE